MTLPLSLPASLTCRNTFLEWVDEEVRFQLRRRSASVPRDFRCGACPAQDKVRPKGLRRRVMSDPGPSASQHAGETPADMLSASGQGLGQPPSAAPVDTTITAQPGRKKRPNRGWGGLPSWTKKQIRKKAARMEVAASKASTIALGADDDGDTASIVSGVQCSELSQVSDLCCGESCGSSQDASPWCPGAGGRECSLGGASSSDGSSSQGSPMHGETSRGNQDCTGGGPCDHRALACGVVSCSV